MTRDAGRPTVLAASDPAAVEAAAAAIRAGEVVAVPTETVYGLACALTDDALERLHELKGRPTSKGITLLVDSLDQAESVAELSGAAARLAEAFWPGPLTLVLPVRTGLALPDLVTGGSAAVGVRLPDHATPRALARKLGPLPLTSANRSGQPEAVDAAGVLEALGSGVAVVLHGGRSAGGVPSTVIAVPGPAGDPFSVLRAGAIEPGQIESALH